MLRSLSRIGRSSAWTPRGLAPTLWVRADRGVTLSGSSVTKWADQSGNGHDLVSAGTPPAWGASNWNGLQPGVSFTGSQFLWNLDSGVGDYVNGTNRDLSVLAVVNAPLAAQGAVAEWTDPSITSILSLWDTDSVSAPRSEFRVPFSATPVPNQCFSGGLRVLGFTWSSGTATCYVDGQAQTPLSLGATFASVSRFFVGNTWNTAASGGTVAELVFLQRAVSAAEYGQFLLYARSLWGGLRAPAYVGSGAPVALSAATNPAYGPNLKGDLFLMQVYIRHSGSYTAPTAPSGWTQQGGPNNQGNNAQYFYTRNARSSGGETGNVTIPSILAGGGQAAIHTFRNVATSSFIEGLAAGGSGSNVSSVPGPTVTSTGAGRLAVALVGLGNVGTIASFAGEAGGTWCSGFGNTTTTGVDSGLQLQSAYLPSAGSISGGSYSPGGSFPDIYNDYSFALVGS